MFKTILKAMLKAVIVISIFAFSVYFYNYSRVYVPWKSSIVKLVPGPAKSYWTAKVLEDLLKKEITQIEWNTFSPPEPGKGVNRWLEDNLETTGIVRLASRFENEEEYRAFVSSCRTLNIEYLEDMNEGDISVYIIGLNFARDTLYYRSKAPIQFTATSEDLLKFVRENAEKYERSRSAKTEYTLFN